MAFILGAVGEVQLANLVRETVEVVVDSRAG